MVIRGTGVLDGQERDFYVRQLKDWKGSFTVEAALPAGAAAYGRTCGWTLARAHARSGDRIAIASYLGKADVFDQAIAAPSMKAALEAWGADSNLFHQGAAKESDDPDVIAATMKKPGVVLKRPVGSDGSFNEHAELPADLGDTDKPATTARKSKGRKPKKASSSPADKATERKAAAAYEREQKHRERDREVVVRPLLGGVGGCEVHGDALGRQREAERGEGARDPIATLAHGLVGKAHEGEDESPGRELDLDIDRLRFDAEIGDGRHVRDQV